MRKDHQCRLASVVLLVLAFAAAVSTASAVSLDAQAVSGGPVVGTYALERALATGASPPDQHYPAMYGDYIVYENGTAGGAAHVVLWNRRTNAYTLVGSGVGWQWRPRIWGNRIVYMDNRDGNWNIYWYDIANKTERRLTSGSNDEWLPEINGDRVVWQDYRDGNWNVYMYDFKTRAETRVTSDSNTQLNPRISGNRIIYQDDRSGNWDIYWYDIAKKTEYPLATSGDHEFDADIWGTRAVWVRTVGGASQIRAAAYFDSRRTSSLLSISSAGDLSRPRLYKETFLWVNADNPSNTHIQMYRFGKFGNLQSFTTGPNHELEPQMWGSSVAWFDTRSGTRDVYVATLPQPGLSVSAPSTTGYGATTRVTGYLKAWDGTPLANRDVKVQYMRDSELNSTTWHELSAKTNSAGKYTAYVPRQNTRFYVRTYYDGDSDAFHRVSSQRTVRPKAYVSRPSGKSTVSRNKYYTYYGYLKPKHTAGSQRVWIKCYRYSRGKYRLRKTYTTTLSDYSSYTKYLKKVKLYPSGKWRIRAYYKSTFNNAYTYSSYRYIRSK